MSFSPPNNEQKDDVVSEDRKKVTLTVKQHNGRESTVVWSIKSYSRPCLSIPLPHNIRSTEELKIAIKLDHPMEKLFVATAVRISVSRGSSG
jgi:hypothetical protein